MADGGGMKEANVLRVTGMAETNVAGVTGVAEASIVGCSTGCSAGSSKAKREAKTPGPGGNSWIHRQAGTEHRW